MLVKKMREAAVKNGVDVQIDAYPISEIEEKAPDAAVILLGPQVRFELNRVKGPVPRKHPGRIHQPRRTTAWCAARTCSTTRSSSPASDLPIPASSDTTALGIPSLIPHHPTPRMTVRREPVTGAANTDERTVQWRTHPKPLTWKCCACR